MTRQEIISDVDEFTEGKAQDRINMERAYTRRLQKFCQSKPFWWRRKIFSKDVVAGDTSVPLSEIRDMEAPSLVELRLDGKRVGTLDANFDNCEISDMQENTTAGRPDSYTMLSDPEPILQFNCPLDAAYKMKIVYWAIPNPSSDNADEAVPLVPAILHHVIFSGLKMDVTAFLYGIKNDMYVVAKAEYDEGVVLAQARPDFSNRKGSQWVDPDNEAIQSRSH